MPSARSSARSAPRLEGQTLQVTTYRGEHYNPKSRKPEVTFGVSLHDDLARRDFTINAMAQRSAQPATSSTRSAAVTIWRRA